MAKSIKFKNDTYLDSTSIVHKKTKLSDLLEPVILFEGNRVTTPITLKDNINNYSYLEFYYTCNGVKSFTKAIAQNGKVSLLTEGEAGIANFMILSVAVIIINNNKISFYKNLSMGGYVDSTLSFNDNGTDGWYRVGIDKIIGYK